MNVKTKIFFILIVGIISFLARLVPHAPNLTPIGSLFLFVGVMYPKKIWIVFAFLIMIFSDVLIGFYEVFVALSVYAGFALYLFIGFLIKKFRYSNIVFGSIFGGCLFFIITNTAVWAFTPWYTKDLAGLMTSFTFALPFFRNTLLGDVIYSSLFFSMYKILEKKNFVFYKFLHREV